MDCLRTNWPKESIPLKLHMLEDHAVQFIKKCVWGGGLVLVSGEQGGGESVHWWCVLFSINYICNTVV